MIPDPAMADATVVRVVASVVVVILAGLFLWFKFFKTRRIVSGEDGERIRFEDAIKDAREARKESADTVKIVMGVQRQMGRLEAENEACIATNKVLTSRVNVLEKQNARQAKEIVRLGGKNTFNPADSDFEP